MSLWCHGVNRIAELDKHRRIIFYEHWLKCHIKFVPGKWLRMHIFKLPFFNVYAFLKN